MVGLRELERRSMQRSLRGVSRMSGRGFSGRGGFRAASTPFALRGARAFGGDAGLAARMVEGGLSPAEAEHIAAAIAQFDSRSTQPAHAAPLGLSLPQVDEIPPVVKNAILRSLSVTVFGPAGPLAVELLFATCDQLRICLAFGVGAAVGAVGGGAGALGLVFAPGRRMGVYGSLGLVVGEIFDLSVGAQVTLVSGGLEEFNGRSYTVGGAIGEGFGISGHFILDANRLPVGLMGELDLRGGAPIRGIVGAWETRSVTTQFAYRVQPYGRSYGFDPYAISYSANETSFTDLGGVPVHYDRLDPPNGYGSKGEPRTFYCTNELKTALGNCMTDLFAVWNEGVPTIILSAGTLGDGAGQHGAGRAFDLDGFYWGDRKFMMDEYPSNPRLYIGINAHLFLYFPQVLNYFYPKHKDHFHVDFNESNNNHFRPSSKAQTYFLQMCLKELFGEDLGTSGAGGIDGDYGKKTKEALKRVLDTLGMSGKDITKDADWREFVISMRGAAFPVPAVAPAPPGTPVPLP